MESHELGQPTLQKDNFSEEVISKILEKGTSHTRKNVSPDPSGADVVNHIIHIVLENPSDHTIHEKLGPVVEPCKICRDVVGDHHVVRKHTFVDTSVNPYMCGICREAFNQGYLLKIHLEVEHGFVEQDHNRRTLRTRKRGGREDPTALSSGDRRENRTSSEPTVDNRLSGSASVETSYTQSGTARTNSINVNSTHDEVNELLPSSDRQVLLTSNEKFGSVDNFDSSVGGDSEGENVEDQSKENQVYKNGDLIVINFITEAGENTDHSKKKSKCKESPDIEEADQHRYKCDFCNLGFPTHRKRSLHAKEDHPHACLKCPLCEAEFAKKKLLNVHLKTHKTQRPPPEPRRPKSTGPAVCTICNKSFLQQSGLQIHRQCFHPELITGKRQFCCEHCGGMFWTKNTMIQHMKVHSDSRPFVCSYCKKGFCRNSDLKSHIKVHTGERPHPCTHCDKTFRQRLQLVNHLRVHTGERPYKCDGCEKAFKKRDQLTRHRRIHTEERPYRCSHCEKAFKTNGQLKDHVRVHTGDRPFKCSHCDKGFAQYTNKVHHERTHSGFKPHVCEVCQKGFTRSNSLTAHMKSHTSKRAKAKASSTNVNLLLGPLPLPTQSVDGVLSQNLVLPQGSLTDPGRLQFPADQQPCQPSTQQQTGISVNATELLASMGSTNHFDEVAAKLAVAASSQQALLSPNLCSSVENSLPSGGNIIGGHLGAVRNPMGSLNTNTGLPGYADNQVLAQNEEITVVGLLSNLSDFHSMHGSVISDFQ